MTIFWIYVVTQLVTTAYGITVINSVKKVPALRKRLANAGYVKQERDSLYRYSDFLKNFILGFIPFYFAIKAVRLINDDDPVRRLMDEEINKGNYITDEDRAIFNEEEERAKNSIAYDPNQELYDTVETYHARKVDLNNIYNDDETPEEYIEKEIQNENIKLTPFTSNYDEMYNTKTYEVVDSSDEEQEEKEDEEDYKADSVYEYKSEIDKDDIKNIIINKEVTNSDIAKAISELSEEELKELSNKLIVLAEIKKNKELLLEKDVA